MITDAALPERESARLDAATVRLLLERACAMLENGGEYAMAALVCHSMAMLDEKYGTGAD